MFSWLKKLFLIINIILYLTLSLILIVIPEFTKLLYITMTINFALTFFLTVAYKDKIRTIMTSSFSRNFQNTILTSLLLCILMGLLNYIFYKYDFTYDLTLDKRNTLTDQSLQILQKLPLNIHLIYFTKKSEERLLPPVIKRFLKASSKLFIEFIDPEISPLQIKKYQIQASPALTLEREDHEAYVTTATFSEEAIVKALLKISEKKEREISIIVGHDEANFQNSNPEGFSNLKNLLEREFYNPIFTTLKKMAHEYNEVYEKSGGSLPTSGILLWGPKTALLPEEIEFLDKYLNNGGRLLISLDLNFKSNPHHELKSLLWEWGIIFENHLVIDQSSFIQGSKGTVPLVSHYNNDHPITRNFKTQTFFPLTGHLRTDTSPQTISKLIVTPLLFTSDAPYSFAETSSEEVKNLTPKFDPIHDDKGPLNLAMTTETREGQFPSSTKIVAFANSTFVSNTYAQFSSQYNLFLNAVEWCLEKENQSTIVKNRPHLKEEEHFLSSIHLAVIFFFNILIIPLLFLGLAVYFYRKRPGR